MANVKVYVRPKTRQSSVESHRSRALSLVEIVSTPIPSDRVSDDLPSRKNASVLTASITAFRELSSPSSELSSRRTGGGGYRVRLTISSSTGQPVYRRTGSSMLRQVQGDKGAFLAVSFPTTVRKSLILSRRNEL